MCSLRYKIENVGSLLQISDCQMYGDGDKITDMDQFVKGDFSNIKECIVNFANGSVPISLVNDIGKIPVPKLTIYTNYYYLLNLGVLSENIKTLIISQLAVVEYYSFMKVLKTSKLEHLTIERALHINTIISLTKSVPNTLKSLNIILDLPSVTDLSNNEMKNFGEILDLELDKLSIKTVNPTSKHYPHLDMFFFKREIKRIKYLSINHNFAINEMESFCNVIETCNLVGLTICNFGIISSKPILNSVKTSKLLEFEISVDNRLNMCIAPEYIDLAYNGKLRCLKSDYIDSYIAQNKIGESFGLLLSKNHILEEMTHSINSNRLCKLYLSRNKSYRVIKEFSTIILSHDINFPPYIILWIVDWIVDDANKHHRRNIVLIENVRNSISKIRAIN